MVPVSGQGIVAGQQVSIDGQWSPIVANPDGSLGFALPREVRAGTSVATLGVGDPPVPLATARRQAFVVRPVVTGATFADGNVRLAMSPPAEANQTVKLTLLARGEVPGESFVSVTPHWATSEVAFPLPATVPPGTYLAFVSVEGIRSDLRYDASGEAVPLVQVP